MTVRRAGLWVGALAVLAYANSIPNGFAYDDTTILAQNEVVTQGRVIEAWTRPYWPRYSEDSGLYRPVTVSSFAAEWRLFGPSPAGYHAANVLVHAGVSILLLVLLCSWTGPIAGAVGAGVFAVHPLHTEAVANIVGRGELYAALFVLAALLLYDRGRSWVGWVRALRLLGVGLLYFLGLGAKEIAVTLPGLMLVTDLLVRPDDAEASGPGTSGPPQRFRKMIRRTWSDAPVYAICAAALCAYLVARLSVVGAVLGDLPAPSLRGIEAGPRILTAISLWPQYARLLLFPLSLSADYSPAVLFPARSLLSVDVAAGLLVLAMLGVGLWIGWRKSPLLCAAVAWLFVTMSPVSHFFFPTGVLLAERTLYLPSVSVAVAATALWTGVSRRGDPSSGPRPGWMPYAALAVVLIACFARTVERNPSWMSTFTVLQTLASEHPESSLAVRTRATGLVRSGDVERGAEMYRTAVELAPANYSVLTEVGNFYGEQGAWADGEHTLRQAIGLSPDRAAAYRLLAGQLIQRGLYRDGHRAALEGLAAAGADRELYALLSETYVAKGDFVAAIRARHAALGQSPHSVSDLDRLVALYGMAGDSASAELAQARLDRARREAVGGVRFTATGRIVTRPEPSNGGAAL